MREEPIYQTISIDGVPVIKTKQAPGYEIKGGALKRGEILNHYKKHRNAKCPCNSGNKFKNCCYKKWEIANG